MHKVFCYITIYLQGSTKITLGIDCWSAITWWSRRFGNNFGRREVANILVADIFVQGPQFHFKDPPCCKKGAT